MWSVWNNTLVYTSFNDAIFADKLCTNTKKIFYLYNVTFDEGFNYATYVHLLRSAEILACRCQEHAEVIFNYCGRKPVVCDSLSNLVEKYYVEKT